MLFKLHFRFFSVSRSKFLEIFPAEREFLKEFFHTQQLAKKKKKKDMFSVRRVELNDYDNAEKLIRDRGGVTHFGDEMNRSPEEWRNRFSPW